jgi:EF hand
VATTPHYVSSSPVTHLAGTHVYDTALVNRSPQTHTSTVVGSNPYLGNSQIISTNTVGTNSNTVKLYNLFEKYDVDNSGYIDESEVANLLQETYQGLGLGYAPNQ